MKKNVQATCLGFGSLHFSANGQPVKKEIQDKKNKICAKIQQSISDEGGFMAES